MPDQENLRRMVDAIIAGKDEEAQTAFHSHVTDVTKNILGVEELPDVPAADDVPAEPPVDEVPPVEQIEDAASE